MSEISLALIVSILPWLVPSRQKCVHSPDPWLTTSSLSSRAGSPGLTVRTLSARLCLSGSCHDPLSPTTENPAHIQNT